MAQRKLTTEEKEFRKYLLRKIADFYHPDYDKREIITKEQYINILLRNVRLTLEKEIENS